MTPAIPGRYNPGHGPPTNGYGRKGFVMSHARDLIIARLGLDPTAHPLAGAIGSLSCTTIDDALALVADYTDGHLIAVADDDRLPLSVRAAARLTWFARPERTIEERRAHSQILRHRVWDTAKDDGVIAALFGVVDGTTGAVEIAACGSRVPRHLHNAVAGKTFDLDAVWVSTDMVPQLVADLADACCAPATGWLANVGLLPNACRIPAVFAGIVGGEVLDEHTARKYLRRAGESRVRAAFQLGQLGSRLVAAVINDTTAVSAAAADALCTASAASIRVLGAALGGPIDADARTEAINDVLAGFDPRRHGHRIAGLCWRAAVGTDLVERLATHPLTMWAVPAALDVVELNDATLARALSTATADDLDRYAGAAINHLDKARIVRLYEATATNRHGTLDQAIGATIGDDLAAWLLTYRPHSAVTLIDRFEHIVRDAVDNQGLLERL